MEKSRKDITVIDISTGDLRRSLGEILNQVTYGGKSYVVMRKGKELGVIVPVELAREIEQMRERRQNSRDELIAMLDARVDLNEGLSDEEVMERANQGIAEVRSE